MRENRYKIIFYNQEPERGLAIGTERKRNVLRCIVQENNIRMDCVHVSALGCCLNINWFLTAERTCFVKNVNNNV